MSNTETSSAEVVHPNAASTCIQNTTINAFGQVASIAPHRSKPSGGTPQERIEPMVAQVQSSMLSNADFGWDDLQPELCVHFPHSTQTGQHLFGDQTGTSPESDSFYDLSQEDLYAAMAEWARIGDDWFAHAYGLTLRANQCSERISRYCDAASILGRIVGHLRALPYRYERAALLANAHQSYILAVALCKGRQPGTEHDPDVFRPDPRLMERAHAMPFRRINYANGHGNIYS